MKVNNDSEKFLGRHFDSDRQLWIHNDGSGGAIPEECRLEMFSQIGTGKGSFWRAFSILENYKKRLNL